MILYDKSECPFCWKVRLGLEHKGIAFSELVVDTDNKSADFLTISPAGKVPVLHTADQQVLNESTLIIHYLEDLKPQPSLLLGGRNSRHMARYLNYYADTVIGPRIRDAIFTQRNNAEDKWDTEAIAKSQEGWRNCLEELQPLLSEEHYFCDGFSMAECALIPRFALAAAYQLTGLDDYPKLKYWFDYHRNSKLFKKTAPEICLPSTHSK